MSVCFRSHGMSAPDICPRRYLPFAMLAGAMLLAACQTGTVSLEEAKRVTASFEGPSYVAPPRTINDLLQLFPTFRVRPTVLELDSCRAGKNRKPHVVAQIEVFKELLKQGSGRDRITVSDYLRSWDGMFDDIKYAYDVYRAISQVEQMRGNIPEAIRYKELQIRSVPYNPAGLYGQLAQIYMLAGNLKVAEEKLENARHFRRRLPNPRDWGRDTWGHLQFTAAEAVIAEATGDLNQAENKFRAAAKLVRENFHGGPARPWPGPSLNPKTLYQSGSGCQKTRRCSRWWILQHRWSKGTCANATLEA